MTTKKDIKAIRLIGIKARTSNSYGRNMQYMRYRVMASTKEGVFAPIEELFSKEELKTISYWSTRSESMSMTCWGTSQYFEAQIALGRWLGFDEKDWPEFSRNVTKFIQEM